MVNLGILRGAGNQALQFALQRARVALRSVRSCRLRPGFGHLRIAQFSDATAGEVQAALDSLRARNGAALKGLVLDLRDPDSAGTVPTDIKGVRADAAVQRALKELKLQSVSGRRSLSAALHPL